MSKLSHRKWRSLVKSKKRKLKRQMLAQQSVQLNGDNDFGYNLLKSDENAEEEDLEDQTAKLIEEQEEQERYVQHLLWMERERLALAVFDAKKAREVKEQQRREEEEKLIKEEWEARQKKEKEEEEERKKSEQERKSRQDELLKQATANERKGNDDGSWHNPIAPAGYSTEAPDRPLCEFFSKIGVCRFRDRCSRSHNVSVDDSCTLLFPGMYSHFEFDQSMRDEYDTDITLEFEDSDIYQHFESFYCDVVPEFKAIGRVVQFKVCCNYEPHLRGNVYVQYHSHKEALDAYAKFNGRWYAGKQLSCQFTCVNRWKQAICGLFHQRKCPKGKNCNFMHVFCNPGNEFHDADLDIFRLGPPSRREHRVLPHDRTPEIRWDRQSLSSRSFRSEYSRTRNARSRSRSRSRRSRRQSRSRSPSRHSRRSPERSPSRNSHSRRSRSPARRRRRRNSADRQRSRVPSSESQRSGLQLSSNFDSSNNGDCHRNSVEKDTHDLTVECVRHQSKSARVEVEASPESASVTENNGGSSPDVCDRVAVVEDVVQSESSDETKSLQEVSEQSGETAIKSEKRHHKKHKSRKHKKHKSDKSRNI